MFPCCALVLPAAVGDRASVSLGDATRPGMLDDATVVFCSLLPEGIGTLLPALQHARARGARVLTLHFPLPGETAASRDAEHRLFLYCAQQRAEP